MIDRKKISITTQSGFALGRQGENGVLEVHFPQSAELMAEEWTLNHQRATDTAAYPVALEKQGDDLVWLVTSGDTAVPGTGKAELTCYGSDGKVRKSMIYNTAVTGSLTTGGKVPDPVQPWYNALLKKIEEGGGGTPDVDELDALAALMDTGAIDPMADETGTLYTDDAGNIYIF